MLFGMAVPTSFYIFGNVFIIFVNIAKQYLDDNDTFTMPDLWYRAITYCKGRGGEGRVGLEWKLIREKQGKTQTKEEKKVYSVGAKETIHCMAGCKANSPEANIPTQ